MFTPQHYTPTQMKVLQLLSDGLRHPVAEIISRCISDEQCCRNNVAQHISKVRMKLRRIGHDIVCELVNRKIYYRHVVLLASASKGTR